MLSRVCLLSLTLLIADAYGAGAATLNVAAGGIDAAGCGTKIAPCRSITRAINDAVAGDKILVGPGRYGDLDADATLGEDGEEGGAGGLVVIDKALTIESVEGAATTLIDAAGANVNAVAIAASGVRFGKGKKGFTVARSAGIGVFIAPGATDVTVSGIRSVRNDLGFGSKASGLTFRGDIAEANLEEGFALTGNGSLLTGCRATGNGAEGFSIGGDGNVLKANVASANGDAGFAFGGNTATLTGSVAAGNDVGLRVNANALTAVGNAFLGNVVTGVVVTVAGTKITKSNIFGNGAANGSNCGITTAGSGTVDLDKICFGAPTGPGPDPADQICGLSINIIEVVKKALTISPKVPL